MKSFLKRIIIFCLPILLSMTAFEVMLRHIPNDYTYKKNYLNNHSKDINVLLLGSSHTYYGLNPLFISGNCFNASHVSQTINLDWEIIKKYDWPKLKYIVLPVDYFTLFHRLDNSVEKWRLKNYNIYYHIAASNSIASFTEITNGKMKDNVDRAIRYYLHGINDINCDSLGYGLRFNLAGQDLEKSGKEAAKKHTIKSMGYFRSNVEVLNQIVQYAQERGIQVLLFTSPAYKSYCDNLDSTQLQMTYQAINQVVATHTNVTYKNYLTDTSFTAADFYDADHLNPEGAKKLSRLLSIILK